MINFLPRTVPCIIKPTQYPWISAGNPHNINKVAVSLAFLLPGYLNLLTRPGPGLAENYQHQAGIEIPVGA